MIKYASLFLYILSILCSPSLFAQVVVGSGGQIYLGGGSSGTALPSGTGYLYGSSGTWSYSTTIPWANVSGAPTSFAPNGSASGDLCGSYPSPTLCKLNGSQSLNGVQGSTGTKVFVCTGVFTPGHFVTVDSNGNCVDGGSAPGSGLTTASSLPATCAQGAMWTNPSPTDADNVVAMCDATNHWTWMSPTMSGTPTVVANSGAGTSPTLALVTGSRDGNGYITLTEGTSPASSAGLVTLQFGNTGYSVAPICSIAPANAAAAALGGNGPWVNQSSATQLLSVIRIGSVPLTAGTAYAWSYSCKLP